MQFFISPKSNEFTVLPEADDTSSFIKNMLGPGDEAIIVPDLLLLM